MQAVCLDHVSVLRVDIEIPSEFGMNTPAPASRTSTLELNELLVSGFVTSQVKIYPFGETARKAVFTLQNSSGRFYVQWNHAAWQPSRGDYVMIRGSVFSVLLNGTDAGRIKAEEVYLLSREKQY